MPARPARTIWKPWWLRRALTGAAQLAFGVVLFDILCFFVLPASRTGFALGYREPIASAARPAEPVELGRRYPRGYFKADDDMGFDIARVRTQGGDVHAVS